MNSLISINHKFMGLTPKELINLVLKSKYTKGVEVCLDVNSNDELKYLEDLVYEIKTNNLILQVHGNVELELEKQLTYIKQLEKYSDYLNMPIILTLHSIYNENTNISVKKTSDYIKKITDSIDNSKIIVCLENLNNTSGIIRLNKEKIKSIILDNKQLYFTYDIGHEIADHKKIVDLNNDMIKEIRNVHIHSYDEKIEDHMPIYINDSHWDEIVKGLSFLNDNNYKYNIVFEYALEYCSGNTVEEKVKNYLSSIDSVSKFYNLKEW